MRRSPQELLFQVVEEAGQIDAGFEKAQTTSIPAGHETLARRRLMLGILPAAGLATRMGGLPKFLLPIAASEQSLLAWHIRQQLEWVERVVIVTRPENGQLLRNFASDSNVTLVLAETLSMNETVQRVLDAFPADEYLLGMPDTFWTGDAYRTLATQHSSDADHSMALWPIRTDQRGKLGQVLIDTANRIVDIRDKDPACKYPHSWGAVRFSRDLRRSISIEQPHIGYAFQTAVTAADYVQGHIIAGTYWDCGTPSEFRRLMGSGEAVDLPG